MLVSARLRHFTMVATLLAACAGGGGATDSSDTDVDSDATAACADVTAGKGWEWSGSCIGMTMGCKITKTGCDLTVVCTGMDMGLPESGSIADDVVTFNDGASLSGCSGTVDDPNTITGTCNGDCEWTLAH